MQMKLFINWIESILSPFSRILGKGSLTPDLNSDKIERCSLPFLREGSGMGSTKAFSIIETITAMVLLTITFGIAISTFDMVMNTDNVSITVNANLTLKQIVAETKKEKTFYDETLERNGFTIQKTVEPYKKAKQKNLIHLQLIARIPEQEKSITTLNTVLLNDEL
jgi:hypothetical protein